MQAQVIIPDLPLDGLDSEALRCLLDFVKSFDDQFDACSKGYPFTVPSARYPGTGAVDETEIGLISSAIGAWGSKQNDRIVEALRNATPTSFLENEWRLEAILEHEIRCGDFEVAKTIIDQLIDGENSKADKKAGA